jgi:hypothetical protein
VRGAGACFVAKPTPTIYAVGTVVSLGWRARRGRAAVDWRATRCAAARRVWGLEGSIRRTREGGVNGSR